jgi:hypothetical protein
MLKGRTMSSLLHTFLRNITFTMCFLLNLSLFLLPLLIIINIFFLFIIYEKFDIGPFKMRLVDLVVRKINNKKSLEESLLKRDLSLWLLTNKSIIGS